MSKSIIVELNQNYASNVYGIGDFEVDFAESINITEGDQLNIKMCSIDSQQNDDETIVIGEDTVINVTFSYYDMLYDVTDKFVNSGGKNPAAGLALTSGDLDYDINTMYRLKGNSRLDTLGVYLTNPNFVVGQNYKFGFEILWVDDNGDNKKASLTWNNPYMLLEGAKILEFHPALGQFLTVDSGSTLPSPLIFRDGTLVIVFKSYSVNGVGIPLKYIKRYSPNDNFTSIGNGFQLELNNIAVTIPKGKYDPDSLAVFLTQELAKTNGVNPSIVGGDNLWEPNNNLLLNTNDTTVGLFCFRHTEDFPVNPTIVFDAANSYVYGVNSNTLIGAGAFSIEYGSAGTVFQVSDAHIPVYNAASPGTRNIAYYKSGTLGVDLRYHEILAESGIVCHDLQPKDFWDRLGLYNRWIVPLRTDTTGLKYYNKTDLIDKIPRGFAGIGNFLLDGARKQPLPLVHNPTYLNVGTETNAVLGEEIRTSNSTTGGFYLVEVQGIGNNGQFIDHRSNKSNIVAVVSKQYNNDSLVTGFSDSGIGSVHYGNPISISRARVRILNPLTKQPDQTLGNNNTIFLQVVKPLQSALQQQAVLEQQEAITKRKKITIRQKTT